MVSVGEEKQLIDTEFNSNWTVAVITIDGCSFDITPNAIIGGVKGIVNRCVEIQKRNALSKDLTIEQMKEGAEILMRYRGIRKWAQMSLYTKKRN